MIRQICAERRFWDDLWGSGFAEQRPLFLL